MDTQYIKRLLAAISCEYDPRLLSLNKDPQKLRTDFNRLFREEQKCSCKDGEVCSLRETNHECLGCTLCDTYVTTTYDVVTIDGDGKLQTHRRVVTANKNLNKNLGFPDESPEDLDPEPFDVHDYLKIPRETHSTRWSEIWIQCVIVVLLALESSLGHYGLLISPLS